MRHVYTNEPKANWNMKRSGGKLTLPELMSHYFCTRRCMRKPSFRGVSNKRDFFPFRPRAGRAGPSSLSYVKKILLYGFDPLSLVGMEKIGGLALARLVLFALLLDVAHRLELNRPDEVTSYGGLCVPLSCNLYDEIISGSRESAHDISESAPSLDHCKSVIVRNYVTQGVIAIV